MNVVKYNLRGSSQSQEFKVINFLHLHIYYKFTHVTVAVKKGKQKYRGIK